MALTPGPQEVEFNNWYETKFKPAMERGPLDKYVARQAWFSASAPLLERIAKLEDDNHNLNWALGTEGFDQMATPEEQAEHEKGHAEVMANIAKMKARKERHDQLVPEGVDYLDHIAALTAQVEQAAHPVATVYRNSVTGDFELIGYSGDGHEFGAHVDVYTAPPKEVPLTVSEVEQILARWSYELHGDRVRYIVRETEQAHGITPATVEKGGA